MWYSCATNFSIFGIGIWGFNEVLNISLLFFGYDYFLSSLQQPHFIFSISFGMGLIPSSMPLSSPKCIPSRVCISPSQLWYSTIIMKEKKTKVARTSQIFQRWTWPLVKQHCLVWCSLVLLFLILLSTLCNLLKCFVPSSLTLQNSSLFSIVLP